MRSKFTPIIVDKSLRGTFPKFRVGEVYDPNHVLIAPALISPGFTNLIPEFG